MSELKRLQEENRLLKQKLEIAQDWMKREISGQIKKIATKKVTETTLWEKACFLHENIEEIVTKKIQQYFGEIMLLNIPSSIIENIISAEINYYNFRHNPKSDWFAVISSYHKALDIIIETYITKQFRKFFNKNFSKFSPENESIEKALFSVIGKNYNLSVGRLFHIIKLIRENEANKSSPNLSSRRGTEQESKLKPYVAVFKKYIQKYSFLETILIKDDELFKLFSKIIESEVLWSKRHSGRISFVDTREARKLIIWEFRDPNSLIYKLIELGEV